MIIFNFIAKSEWIQIYYKITNDATQESGMSTEILNFRINYMDQMDANIVPWIWNATDINIHTQFK